ncbi:MAG: hypothetical protein AAF613_08840 [Pseudomonadota bacterium]
MKQFFAGLVGLFVIAACEATSTTNFSPVVINQGVVANEGLTIKAVDGSFELRGGERFQTPFSVVAWRGSCPGFKGGQDSELLTQYTAAKNCGSKAVTIELDNGEKLYGVLFLGTALRSSTGPSAQSYYVTIPNGRINEALNGNITVAYEKVKWVSSWSDGSRSNKNWYSWVLWMSSVPL